jgi:O-methyltransferase
MIDDPTAATIVPLDRRNRRPPVPAQDSVFVVTDFDWAPPELAPHYALLNRILRRLRAPVRLAPAIPPGRMTNVEQRMNMFHLVSQVLAYGVPGDVVELGCYVGQSAVLMQKVIAHADPSRRLHVYDSFAGIGDLHEKDGDTIYRKGEMRAAIADVRANFTRYGLRQPEIHPGWFRETLPDQLPDQICFAHLDGDLYEAILQSLEAVYPRLSEGAICLIDDYADPAVFDGWNLLPGVKRACDEFLADKPEKMSVLYCGRDQAHGYFRKLAG